MTPTTTTPAKDPLPKKEEARISAPATIVVSLPAEATLSVDDHATTSTSATRTFVSPALNFGQEYTYELKAEIVRDGKTVTTTKQVNVHAGSESRVQLDFPTATVASK